MSRVSREVPIPQGLPNMPAFLTCSQSSTKDGRKFVLKNIPERFEYYRDFYQTLEGSHHLRLLHDTIPDQSIFIHEYRNHHLLNLALRELPLALTKRILRDALRGLATLHRHDFVHAGKLTSPTPVSLTLTCARHQAEQQFGGDKRRRARTRNHQGPARRH